MKRLPIGIQTFSELVDPGKNFVYVDKTEVVHTLVTSGKYYFLSRPRRFGKSVLVSTLDALFSAAAPLFEGLAIANQWDWSIRYPVIRISFGSGEYRTEQQFEQVIFDNLKANRRRLGVPGQGSSTNTTSCFRDLIEEACVQYGQKVVILVDEYDRPVLDHITDKSIARRNRDKLKGFYSVIKDLDEYVRFVLITGVTKFSKMNLFSGLNNLEDITIDETYGTICGYTHPEVESYFAGYLSGVDKKRLQDWYNGYNYFGEPIYNPFDILLFFSKGCEYRPYWWSTGNPSFLIDLLRQRPRYLPELENYIADDIMLDTFDVDSIDLAALLWQTGYLTLAEKFIKRERIHYRLKVPNKEIQLSLNELFVEYLTGHDSARLTWQDRLYDTLLQGDMESFHRYFSSLFSSIPYQNYANAIIKRYEGYYASVVYAYLASLGFTLVAEDVTNQGRIDLTLILPDRIYIMEFKVDQPGQALQQIHARRYQEKYLDRGKIIYLIGINFNSRTKNIEEFEWEVVEPPDC